MALPAYAGPLERSWYYGFRFICGLIFFFLIAPIVVIVPLSFNAVPFFTFTEAMLSLDPAGYSLKWYDDFFTNANWQGAVQNSIIIAFFVVESERALQSARLASGRRRRSLDDSLPP